MSAEKLEQEGRRRRRLFGRSQEVEEVAEPVDEEESRGLAAPKGRATPSNRRRQDEEEDKGNFITRLRTGFVEYILGVRSEMEKVVWPDREELRRLTIIVIGALIGASLILGTISVAFTELFTIGINRPVILFGFIGIAAAVGYYIWRRNGRRVSAF